MNSKDGPDFMLEFCIKHDQKGSVERNVVRVCMIRGAKKMYRKLYATARHTGLKPIYMLN